MLNRRLITQFVAAAIIAASAPLVAQEPGGRRERPPFPERESSLAELDTVLDQAQGILLVDSQYLPPPLAMRVEKGQLQVNGIPVLSTRVQDDERPRRWRPSPEALARDMGVEIADRLVAVQVVVALDGQPLVVLSTPDEQIELLRQLARLDAAPRPRRVSIHESLPAALDRDVWNRWVEQFSPTPEFTARAREHIEIFERTEREANAAAAATRRLHDWSYPLSLVGMIAAVLGFGHLLSHRPPVAAKALDIDASPLAVSVLTWSLVLVVLYSALDLTWTILAYQAGQMLEMNPLGSHLVEDPIKLMVFKAGATAVSVGLLFALRKYCKAQLAAWWICLILTLLTARWLVMSSMFVA